MFVVYVVISLFLLWLAKKSKWGWFDLICVWMATFLFLQAGFIGADGWLGDTINKVVYTTNSTGDQVLANATGASVFWIASFILAVVLITGLLPWWEHDVPDWLTMFGVILPSFMKSIPDPAGSFLIGILQAPASFVGSFVSSWFGG